MSNGQGTYTWGNGEWKGDKYVGKFKNDQGMAKELIRMPMEII